MPPSASRARGALAKMAQLKAHGKYIGRRYLRINIWIWSNLPASPALPDPSPERFGFEPRTPHVESPQSNGMAEAFVRTIKRDCVRVSQCPDTQGPDTQVVMRQLPIWFAHYNEVRPHKPLGYCSP
jgi:transposase InsO family protein